MKVKISELTGPSLDWAVAVAEKKTICVHASNVKRFDDKSEIHCSSNGCTFGAVKSFGETEMYSPSTDWAIGGPLIQEYCMGFSVHNVSLGANWLAYSSPEDKSYQGIGETHLIAACRLIVGAHFNSDEIDVPGELL